MNKIERVSAVLHGKPPDRLPVSFWYHFGPDAVSGPEAVESHVRHVETYDLDFLKVMCDGRYPFPYHDDGIIHDVGDLDRLVPLAGDEDLFGRHLEVLQALSRRFAGELWMTTTIFNSWSTLRRLMASDSDVTVRRRGAELPMSATPSFQGSLPRPPTSWPRHSMP